MFVEQLCVQEAAGGTQEIPWYGAIVFVIGASVSLLLIFYFMKAMQVTAQHTQMNQMQDLCQRTLFVLRSRVGVGVLTACAGAAHDYD